MELLDEPDEATGEMVYWVIIEGEEPIRFPTKEARDKFLFRLWLDLLQKMLHSQLLQDALEWLWQQQREEMLLLQQKEEARAQFVLLLLQQDQQYFLVPAAIAQSLYMQQLARDWVVLACDFVLTANRLVPIPADADEDETKP